MLEAYSPIYPVFKDKTIYSIPIKEAFEKEGCPFCSLSRDTEARELEYILGGAHMEPSEREKTNLLGFCREHTEKMLGMKNRLALALILESRMSEMLAENAPLSHGCYICAGLKNTLWAYFENAVHLWSTDKSFAAGLRVRSDLCLNHAGGLIAASQKNLKGAKSRAFLSDIHAAVSPRLKYLLGDLRGFIRSFDHKNARIALTEAELTALERTLELLG